jgi:hypothetical protein
MSYGSDHYHYDYADTRHDHRGQYADDRHDHGLDYAEKHHRHYDDESTARGLRENLSAAEARIRDLEDGLRGALNRIHALEDRQPDYAAPDMPGDYSAEDARRLGEAEPTFIGSEWAVLPPNERGEVLPEWMAGVDQAGESEPEEYNPGPEVDDEGGMSEYRYMLPEDYQRGQS